MIRFLRSTQGAAASSTPTSVNLVWGPASLGEWKASGALATYALDDADDSEMQVLAAPKDGTINKVGMLIPTVTGDPPAYNVGLVTLDANGAPTTTAFGGSAAETVDFSTTGFIWVTLSTPATVQAGDLFAVRVWPTASSPSGAACVAIADEVIIASVMQARKGTYSTAFTQAAGYGAFAVQYSTGETVGLPITATMDEIYDAADSPDEAGGLFTVPTTMVCRGARIGLDTVGSGTSFTVKLYGPTGTLLASCDVPDEDHPLQPSAASFGTADFFWDPVTLSPNTNYRLTVLGTHATSTVAPGQMTFESAASKTNNITIPEVTRWSKTERTNEGEWTDTATALPWFALLVSSITLPG
jgi:hypothetical protein